MAISGRWRPTGVHFGICCFLYLNDIPKFCKISEVFLFADDTNITGLYVLQSLTLCTTITGVYVDAKLSFNSHINFIRPKLMIEYYGSIIRPIFQ